MGKTGVLKFCNTKNQNTDELFIENIKEYKINLYRLAKSILKNEADVEDAVSETILNAYSKINRLRSFDKFKPWIMQILANECYKICRLRRRTRYSDNMEEYIESPYEENKSGGDMWALVSSLDEKFRAIVVLFYYEDISIKDISKILDIPIGTVKSRLSRSREKLKVLIEKEEGN